MNASRRGYARGADLSGTAEPAAAAFDPFGAVTLDGVFVG